MNISLELYRIFREVAAEGSISGAAKTLFVSQSAVSQAIKQLESRLELSLFRRTPRGVQLTDAGRLLNEYAASAMNLLEAAEGKLDGLKNRSLGDLKIGASDTLSRHLLLGRLEQFSKRFPGIKLQIVNRTSLEAIALLKAGKIDLAFVNMPLSDAEIEVTDFLAVQDIFVGTPAYDTKIYTLEELAALPLILLESKSNSRCYVEDFFRNRGVSIAPEIELGSHDLLLEFARIQLGVSCVIRGFSRHYLDSGVLRELRCETAIPPRHIGIATLRGVTPSPAAKSFIAL